MISLIIRLTLTSGLFFGFFHQTQAEIVPLAEDSCARVLEVSEELKTAVLDLEAELDREQNETSLAHSEVVKIESNIEHLKSKMSWVERNLWAWLAKLWPGTDDVKIDKLKDRTKKRKLFIKRLKQDQREDALADAAVLARIDQWLVQHDQQFAELRNRERQLSNLVCDGERCISVIRNALDAVDSAQSQSQIDMNRRDGESNSSRRRSRILMRRNQNSYAHSLARQAESEAHSFARDVRDFYDLWAREVQMNSVDDSFSYGNNLMIDMIFGPSSDFANLMNLFALDDLEDDLEELRRRVENLHHRVATEERRLEADIKKIICDVREICNQ